MFDQESRRSRGFGFVIFQEEQVVDKICKEHFIFIKGKKVRSEVESEAWRVFDVGTHWFPGERSSARHEIYPGTIRSPETSEWIVPRLDCRNCNTCL